VGPITGDKPATRSGAEGLRLGPRQENGAGAGLKGKTGMDLRFSTPGAKFASGMGAGFEDRKKPKHGFCFDLLGEGSGRRLISLRMQGVG
jgi:hypothetical protein